MNRRFAFVVFALCAIQVGCASVKTLNTSGEVSREKRVTTARLIADWKLPASISIRKMSNAPRGAIDEFDKKQAVDDAYHVIGRLSYGFENNFANLALQHGLEITDIRRDTPRLRVSISAATMHCTSFGCMSVLDLRGELIDGSGNRTWSFFSKVGQANTVTEISDKIYTDFATELLLAMTKDGVIAKK